MGENVIEKPEKVIENIDNELSEIPEPPEIELANWIIYILSTKADEILQDGYINDNALNEKTIEEIKNEYNFDQIKDAFDEGKVPTQREFFFGRDNDNFVNASNLIELDEDNNEFVSFHCSDMEQNMMTDNSLSIHIESRNIFHDNFNTNKNLYNFLLVQQDETKTINSIGISYHDSFERYMKQFLPAFSLKKSKKIRFADK